MATLPNDLVASASINVCHRKHLKLFSKFQLPTIYDSVQFKLVSVSYYFPTKLNKYLIILTYGLEQS